MPKGELAIHCGLQNHILQLQYKRVIKLECGQVALRSALSRNNSEGPGWVSWAGLMKALMGRERVW